MSDQAKYLRKLAEKNKNVGDTGFSFSRVIAVTSGKGGVGKTNFATNLAIELAALKKKVVVFYADLGLANIDIVLGINPQFNLSHVIRGQKSLQDIIVDVPYGFKLIPASSGIAELADLSEYEMDKFINDFELIDKDTDILIVDTAAGIAKNVLNFVLASKEVMLVTTKEPTAITDAYALIKVLATHKKKIDIKLIINMCETEKEAKIIADKLIAVSKSFLDVDIHYFGFIFRDKFVSQAVLKRKPLVKVFPNSMAAKSIRQLSLQVARGETDKKEQESFFKRLKNFLTQENLNIRDSDK